MCNKADTVPVNSRSGIKYIDELMLMIDVIETDCERMNIAPKSKSE